MKRITQILSLALAIFTFAGSIGIGVFTHFCHEDGIEQSFILPKTSCCEEKWEKVESCCAHEVEVVEEDCCSDEVDFFQIDFENFETNELFSFVPSEIHDISNLDLDFSEVSIEIQPNQYANPPPLRSGKQILIQHQVFRI